MISDEMLEKAAAELADVINDSLPNPSECNHQFSAKFEKKMKRLMYKTYHPILYRTLRSVASIVLVIMIGFGSTLTVSAEAREIVFGWVKQQYECFYKYFLEGEVDITESATYQLGWVPDGYEFLTSYETAGGEVYIYTDEKDTLIQFTYTSDPNNEMLFVDGISYIKEQVEINNRIGEVYISEDNNTTNGLIWSNETNTIIFFISANCETDTLIKIAESVVKK